MLARNILLSNIEYIAASLVTKSYLIIVIYYPVQRWVLIMITTNLALIDRTIVWSETCKEQNIKQLLATEKNKEINKPGLCHHNSSYFLISTYEFKSLYHARKLPKILLKLLIFSTIGQTNVLINFFSCSKTSGLSSQGLPLSSKPT